MRYLGWLTILVILTGCGALFYDSGDLGGVPGGGSASGDLQHTIGIRVPGLYDNDQVEITLTSANADTIYYTTDGSDPELVAGSLYTAPINASNGTSLRGVARNSSGTVIGTITVTVTGAAEGTLADPYLVSSPEHLSNIRFNPNSVYRQDQNITLIGNWNPIGVGAAIFTGVYDGQNNSIDGLAISSMNGASGGLFGVCSGATIRNVVLVNVAIIQDSDNAGALAGYISGNTIIENCSSTGSISLSMGATGIDNTGGLIGKVFESKIYGSYSTVQVEGMYNAGGFVGSMGGSSLITRSYASGYVQIPSGDAQSFGGFVGVISGGEISQCYSTGSVTGAINRAGGFIGLLSGSGTTVSIENCYATGSVSGKTNVGGIVGYMNNTSGKIRNCYYAVGSVAASQETPGGFGGQRISGDVESCYWNSETSSTALDWAVGTTTGVSGQTTSSMGMQSTYIGWDFTSGAPIWSLSGGGYPYLVF